MPQNVKLIQELYGAFARGDVPAVLGAFHPEIVWNEAEGYAYADGNPYVGPDRILKGVFMRLGTEWDGFTVSPEEFIDGGDAVVATGRYRGTHRATGRAVNAQFAHVWGIRDGQIVRFQQYVDTAQMAWAAAPVVPSPLPTT